MDTSTQRDEPAFKVRADDVPDPAESLERIEARLEEIRVLLDQQRRAQTHREFSLARNVAGPLQAVVIGLLAWAVSDWAFAASGELLLTKLGFAIALQLITLTALLASRRDA